MIVSTISGIRRARCILLCSRFNELSWWREDNWMRWHGNNETRPWNGRQLPQAICVWPSHIHQALVHYFTNRLSSGSLLRRNVDNLTVLKPINPLLSSYTIWADKWHSHLDFPHLIAFKFLPTFGLDTNTCFEPANALHQRCIIQGDISTGNHRGNKDKWQPSNWIASSSNILISLVGDKQGRQSVAKFTTTTETSFDTIFPISRVRPRICSYNDSTSLHWWLKEEVISNRLTTGGRIDKQSAINFPWWYVPNVP